MKELARAADGLWYMSESDYPLEPVRLEGTDEPRPDHLRDLADAAGDAHVERKELKDFFRDGAAVRITKEGATGASFEGIVRALKENLADIRVYRIGEINIPVYVLGKSGSGNWLGIRTRVVET